MPFVKSSTIPHTTKEADADPDQHFQHAATRNCQVKDNCKKNRSVGDAINAKNPFVENALPVHNVCAQAANKILAYCHNKLIYVLPIYITCLVRFDLFVLFC